MSARVLACRLDNLGDVLLTGPAIRSLAARAEVVMLTSAAGASAASLLPGVGEIIEFDAPWVGYEPPVVDDGVLATLASRLRSSAIDQAVIFTSFHQSSLPLALVLRVAGVRRITAISEDYPGSLLDVRCRYSPELHEVEQNLAVAAAAGFSPLAGDDRRLRVELPPSAAVADLPERYVVVHPGASVAARALPHALARSACAALVAHGYEVVVTGGARETRAVARAADGLGPSVQPMAGTLTLADLGSVLAGADAIVCGNTGPAHLAAAVGTPVVELFAPVVDPGRWHPWGVRYRLLGDLTVPCAGCRSRVCPLAEQRCVREVDGIEVVSALGDLLSERSVA